MGDHREEGGVVEMGRMRKGSVKRRKEGWEGEVDGEQDGWEGRKKLEK